MAGTLGAFLAILDIQITNSSLQQIEGAISASPDEGGWISTAYLIAEVLAIPLTGWLASVLTLRNFLLGSTFLFLIASIGCGLCTTLNELIVFRVFQGLTGGTLIPTAISIVRSRLPVDQQPVGITLFSLVATLAPALGPTVGGWLTENFSWHYLFFINLGPGALALFLQYKALDRGVMRPSELLHGDWIGVILMSVGLGSLTVVLEEGRRWDWFDSGLISGLTFISVVSLACFVVIELTAENPLIKLRLFTNPKIGASSILMGVFGATAFGSLYLIPVYMGEVQGYGALQIGEAVMWSGFPQIFVLPFMPFLIRRVDPRILLVAGGVFFAVSCFINAFMTHDTGVEQLILPQLLRALGQPLFMMPLLQLSTAGLPPRDTSDASAISNVMRNVGASIGIAFFSTMLADLKVRHFSYLSSRLTQNSALVHDRLATMAAGTGSAAGADHSMSQALGLLTRQVQREAAVMAFSDCFEMMGFAIIASLLAVFLLRRSKPQILLPIQAVALPAQS